MIGRVRGRADTARGRDSAALDVDGGLIKGVAAGADAGTGSPAASVLIAAALGLNDGDDGAVVAVADGDGGAAHRGIVDVTDIMAGADARSGGAAGGGNFCCTLDEDGGVAIGVAAAADACAAAAAKGGITAAGGRNGHAVAESDAGVAGGVAARTDARAALVAVAAARGLNSAARNINGSLSGRRETGTDACAVAYIPDVDKALGCDIAVFDLDVGVALGAIAAADAGTIITRSIDGAAGDLDVRGVGRIAAAADGCTGVAGGCDVAVSDMDNGLEGVRRTRRRTVEVSFTAAADGCAVAADGLYRAAFYRDGGVALGAFAAANASARVISGISGGLQRAHRRVADGDVSLAGGVMTAADACTVVGKSMFDTLSGSCIVDVDGRLAGGGFARTDGCAAAAIRVHERILGDDMAQDKKPVTVNHYLRDVRVFLNWCMDDDHHYIEKPFKMKEMTMQDTKPKAFCDEDMARLMEKPNLKADFPEWRTYAIVCWIMDNGSRTETVCCAKMSDVDFKNKTITFSHTKNRKAQVVGMSDALSSILKEYIRKWRYDVGGDAWLFPNIGGEQLMGEWTPLRVQAVLSEPGREAAQCAWSAAYLFALLYKK